MFEFTTLTVLNLVNVITAAQKAEGTAGNIITSDGDNPSVRIGNIRFTKDVIVDVQRKVYTPEHLTSVTFDLEKITEELVGTDKVPGIYRIAIYLGLSMGSQDSFYSNDLLYKGKPLYIEFPIKGSTITDEDASRIVSIANKYMLFMAQEKILNVSASGKTVTFTGINGYQQIKKAVLQRFDEDAIQIDCCSNDGEFVTKIEGVPEVWTLEDGVYTGTGMKFENGIATDPDDTEELIEPGLEEFGGYNWIIHNLRLPTAANTNFWAVTKPEMPTVGGQYDQFIIRMKKERDGIAGEAVGMRVTSITTHVFWVPTDLADTFEELFTSNLEVDPIKTDADDVLNDPYRLGGSGNNSDNDSNDNP